MTSQRTYTSQDCVFHGDRYVFDALVRDLRKAGLLRQRLAKVMAMTVCTCRKKAVYRQPLGDTQVHEAADTVLQPSLPPLDPLSPQSRHLVTSSAMEALRSSEPVTSQCRLTVVIAQALQGEFTLLEEETAANISKTVGTTAPSGRKKPGPLPRDILNKIVARRKQKLPMKTISVPMFGGSTRTLLADPRVGLGFSALRRKLASGSGSWSKALVVEIDSEATAAKMALNTAVTVLKVWSSSLETQREVDKVLTTVAQEIQGRSSNTWRRRVEYMKLSQQRWRLETRQTDDPVKSPDDYKQNLTRDFEKKVIKKQHNGKGRNSRPPQRDDGSSIAQGHCLHCLMTYREFKQACQRDANSDVKRTCRHHPGYVIGEKWTCCGNDSESQHPTHKEHAQNGCSVGRQHSFRPHKKCARGVGAKSYRYERSFRSRRVSVSPFNLLH